MSHQFDLKTGGIPLEKAAKALIMLHGRGGNGRDILTLSELLSVDDYALLAPQATGNTWYPYSFMAPAADNEPWLSSAVDVVTKAVAVAVKAGIARENIYFFGFSQGACLMLEFLARNAGRYGGAAAVIGGLIGKEIDRSRYRGDFQQTPVLIATSNPDFHVPVERVYATSNIYREMNADVTEKVYENAGHGISHDHIDLANRVVFSV